MYIHMYTNTYTNTYTYTYTSAVREVCKHHATHITQSRHTHHTITHTQRVPTINGRAIHQSHTHCEHTTTQHTHKRKHTPHTHHQFLPSTAEQSISETLDLSLSDCDEDTVRDHRDAPAEHRHAVVNVLATAIKTRATTSPASGVQRGGGGTSQHADKQDNTWWSAASAAEMWSSATDPPAGRGLGHGVSRGGGVLTATSVLGGNCLSTATPVQSAGGGSPLPHTPYSVEVGGGAGGGGGGKERDRSDRER